MTHQQVSEFSWCSFGPGRKEPADPEVARLAQPARQAIRQELGEWISRARAAAGLHPREVATRMGYRKLDRGMARLARWERGEDGVWGDRIPLLAAALGAPVEELLCFGRRELDLLAASQVEADRRGAADQSALDAERGLLGRHAASLLELVRSDDALARVPDVVLRSTGFSIMLMGAGYFSLRALLGAWRSGRLTLECDCCGGPLLLTWVWGSPLSGTHRLRGSCASTGRLHTPRLRRPGMMLANLVSPVLEVHREVLERRRAGEAPPQDLTLAEALGFLGYDVGQVSIRDGSGSPLAIFEPVSGAITPVEGAMRPVGDKADAAELALQVVTQRGPSRIGGMPVIGSLAPLSFGCWTGEVMKLVGPDKRVWRLHPGHLEDSDLRVVAWFDDPVPVAVAAWVIHTLGQG